MVALTSEKLLHLTSQDDLLCIISYRSLFMMSWNCGLGSWVVHPRAQVATWRCSCASITNHMGGIVAVAAHIDSLREQS